MKGWVRFKEALFKEAVLSETIVTAPVFLGSIPNMYYYSLKITSIVIIMLYVITMDVIEIYPRPISCHRDVGVHRSRLT